MRVSARRRGPAQGRAERHERKATKMTQQGIQESQTQAAYKLEAPDAALPAGGASGSCRGGWATSPWGLVFPAALLLAVELRLSARADPGAESCRRQGSSRRR